MNSDSHQTSLSSTTVLLTRPIGQNGELKGLLESAGASTKIFPLIEILDLQDFSQLDGGIESCRTEVGWACFFSRNGVKHFFRRAEQLGLKIQDFQDTFFACVGESTAAELRKHGLEARFVPDGANAEEFAKQFFKKFPSPEQKLFLFVADRGKDTAELILRAHFHDIQRITTYQHQDTKAAPAELVQQVAEGYFDWVVITSSAAAETFVRLFDVSPFGQQKRLSKIATISPITAQKLTNLGLMVDAVAKESSPAGIFRAIFDSSTDQSS